MVKTCYDVYAFLSEIIDAIFKKNHANIKAILLSCK